MAPFQYSAYVNPYEDQIAQTMLRAGQIRADEAKDVGAAQAQAQAQSGAAWGQAAQGVGADVANTITAATDPKRQLEQQQVQANKTAMAVTAKANQIQSGLMNSNPDGTQTIDRQKLVAAFTAANIPVEEQSKRLKALDDADDSISKFQQSKIDHLADLADSVIKGGGDENALAGGLALGKANGSITDQQAQFLNEQLQKGRSIPDLMKQVRASSPKYKDADKGVVLAGAPRPGGSPASLVNPETGTTIATGLQAGPEKPPTPTEASLAADAANPNSPTQAQSAAALDRLKPKVVKPSSEWEDFKTSFSKGNGADTWDALSPVQQQAGIAKFKTIATDDAAVQAANRQATALQGQIAQQKRGQDFTQLQAARADIEKNVQAPYLQAKTSANTLRDVVQAAQNGNKVAASMQSLETTMAAIRAQGLNRINKTETDMAGDAGSLFDRIQGYIGKKAVGQPVPADIQKDMLQFSDILENAAYKKYLAGHQASTDLYGVSDKLKPTLTAPTPSGPAQPAEGTKGTVKGQAATWKTVNGKTGWYAD